MTVTPIPGKLKQQADSYGGIVAALVKLRERNGLGYKAYDSNFQGIIEALTDFAILGNSGEGEIPPGWEIITDENGDPIDGDWQYYPKNGQLWFDERQGRLFVWVDDGFYQTNGNDGLTVVSETAPDQEVTGGMWYNPTNKALYIWNGASWDLIDGAAALTAEDLFINQITFDIAADAGPIITPYDTGGAPLTQGTYNRWVSRSLDELEALVHEHDNDVIATASDTPPSNPDEGDLWFDTSDLNLYVYYTDNDSSQWVPAFNTLQDNDDFVAVSTALNALSQSTSAKHAEIDARFDSLPLNTYALASDLSTGVSNLTSTINALTATVGDLNRFATVTGLSDSVQVLNTRIDEVEAQAPDLTGLATELELENIQSGLTNLITTTKLQSDAYADQKASEVAALIPDISGKANAADLQSFIALAAQNYFPRLGGTLNGTFGMQKADIALPSFDFSNAHYYGNKVFKFKTNSISDQYVEFGTNDNPWEYAWEFDANEDFCWKHTDAGKVFSISEQGPACEKLTIGNFGSNTSGGRRLTQTIEVGEEIRSHKATLTAIKSAVLLSNDFDTFKVKLLEALAVV